MDLRRNLQYCHQHRLPKPNLPVPHVRFRVKRSAEDADLREWDEHKSMGDEFDCEYENTETDPTSPAEVAAGRDAEKKMLMFHESLPQDTPHRDLPVITLVPRGACSSDPISTTWVDKARRRRQGLMPQGDARLQDMGSDRLAVRRNSVTSHTAHPCGRGGSAKVGCRVLRRHQSILAHTLVRTTERTAVVVASGIGLCSASRPVCPPVRGSQGCSTLCEGHNRRRTCCGGGKGEKSGHSDCA